MPDWTYEMLRYAFSWNEESADKGMKYVVTTRMDVESLSEFQLLDILLLTILSEKDEVERTSALIFLEEHGASIVFDYTTLHKVCFVLDNLLGSPVDGQSMTYSLKSQVLVSYTALLIQFNCFESDATRFEGFVDLLVSIVKHTNKSADRMLRSFACECLHELENWYPGLLFPLLGDDWNVSGGVTGVPASVGVGANTLGKFVNDEQLHVQESYARLFFTTFQHFTEEVVQEALKRPPAEDDMDFSLTNSIAGTPSVSRSTTPPDTPRGSGRERGRQGEGAVPGTSSNTRAYGGMATTSYGLDTFRFRIPPNCKRGPQVSFEMAVDQTPPRLPRKLVRTMTRSISLVLDSMKLSASWTKAFLAERLTLFIRVLALSSRVVFHHFSPLLYASRPLLLHSFLVVTTSFSREVDLFVIEAVVDRLFALSQDTATEPCFRLLAITWLIALSSRDQSGGTFELLLQRVQGLTPRWHDPLELKEMKLQALLYCFRVSGRLPGNLLSVLESMSEFIYCCRPVGAHSVVFRFLLRLVLYFAPEMDRLEVPQCLCDFLRSHPKLLPSVLSVARWSNSDAVRHQLLRSFGEFVARLEPPSRIQCYFGLLVSLAGTAWLDPGYVLEALRRLIFCHSSALTWQVGMRVLITCRIVILTHPQAVIYAPMQRLLNHLARYQECVDLRDRALLYQRLLTHAGSAPLGKLFQPRPGDVEHMTQMLTAVLPRTIRLAGGPVPFLRFSKSLDERRKLGIMDRQCAILVLPPGRNLTTNDKGTDAQEDIPQFGAMDWEVRWGDAGEDHQFPKEWVEFSLGGRVRDEDLRLVLKSYREQVQAKPPSIRMPFMLEYTSCTSLDASLDSPRQLFSLELTFSSIEHFVPIEPIRIPYIAAEEEASEPNASGFPSSNKLLLRLQPITPVSTSFGVSVAFNDSVGNMYFGQLGTFHVAFQDLFLPVRMPLVFWSSLFESLWKGGLDPSCWSVKVLDMDREAVGRLLASQLGPFIVASEAALDEEDFDFEQEALFARASAAEEGDGSDSEGESCDENVVVKVDTTCVIVFIPPCHHLLMRFTMSTHSTIVRVLTDRFQLLAHMDSFFASWSRPGACNLGV